MLRVVAASVGVVFVFVNDKDNEKGVAGARDLCATRRSYDSGCEQRVLP